MLLVVLTNGQRRWVDWDTAREFQRKGTLVYVLKERNGNPAEYDGSIYEIPTRSHSAGKENEARSFKEMGITTFPRPERPPEFEIYE